MIKVFTRKFITILCLQLFLFNSVWAVENTPDIKEKKNDSSVFTIGAQIRPRFEYRHGYKHPFETGLKPATYVEQRTRLWFDYTQSDLRVHINLQDIRMWGSTSTIYKTDPAIFNVYEAYGEFKFNANLSFKLGRQEISYDNGRFFCIKDWFSQGYTMMHLY